jgi:hypothetical protein
MMHHMNYQFTTFHSANYSRPMSEALFCSEVGWNWAATSRDCRVPSDTFCQSLANQKLAGPLKISQKNTWQESPNDQNRDDSAEEKRRHRKRSENRTYNLRLRLLSTTKLVTLKEGQLHEARPERGVLKAFLLGHTSACCGA